MRRTALAALALAACSAPAPDPGDAESSATDTTPPVTTTADATTADDPDPISTTTTEDPGTTEGPDTTAPGPTTDDPATTTLTTTTDATTGAPVGCADLPLCDGFETAVPAGPPDPALWTVTSPNCAGTGTLAVDDAEAHGGGNSLRVDGGGGYCDHVFIAHTAAIDALGPVVYGRFWLRLGAPLGQGHVTFMTLRDAADSGGKDLRMGGQSEILMWNRESDDATLPALSPAGIALSVAPPAGVWTCVEFMIDEAGGRIDTWVDGAPVAGLVVDAEPTPDVDQQWHNKPNWQPALADFKLGWESYAGQTMTLHFDDVALADSRLGCD